MGGSFSYIQVKQMNGITSKTMQSIKFLLDANFYLSVIILIAGGLSSITDNYSIFEFNEDLYGALDNNLRIMMVYLAITEIVVIAYCLFRKKFQIMAAVGFFLVLMIGSMEFYGEVNAVEIDPSFSLFFLYTGISHILFGVMVHMEKNGPHQYDDEPWKLSK